MCLNQTSSVWKCTVFVGDPRCLYAAKD